MVIDTGLSNAEKDFVSALAKVVDPADVRWLWITHPDRDHTGLRAQARLVTTFLGLGIPSTEWTLPLDRLFLLNPGQALDVGDRRLHCFRPPLFDNPSTTGFLDDRTGVLFSSDCFGAPMPSEELATSSDVRAVGDEVRDFQLLWASIDSPWVHQVDPAGSAPRSTHSVLWTPRRSSAPTSRLCSSRTTGSSKPCCSPRRQPHSSDPTKRHSRPCSPHSPLAKSEQAVGSAGRTTDSPPHVLEVSAFCVNTSEQGVGEER